MRPQTVVRYVAGFRRVSLSNDASSPSDILWIQRSPNSNPPITPEQLTTMLPKAAAQVKPDVERLMKDIASADSGAAHYEQRLGAVVWRRLEGASRGQVSRLNIHHLETDGNCNGSDILRLARHRFGMGGPRLSFVCPRSKLRLRRYDSNVPKILRITGDNSLKAFGKGLDKDVGNRAFGLLPSTFPLNMICP